MLVPHRGCTTHFLRFARHVHDEYRNHASCFLRPRNISVPSCRPRQRQEKRYTLSSESQARVRSSTRAPLTTCALGSSLSRQVTPAWLRVPRVLAAPCDCGVAYGQGGVVRAEALSLAGAGPVCWRRRHLCRCGATSDAGTRRPVRRVPGFALGDSWVVWSVPEPRGPGWQRSDGATCRARFASRPGADRGPPLCRRHDSGQGPGDGGVRCGAARAFPVPAALVLRRIGFGLAVLAPVMVRARLLPGVEAGTPVHG